MRGTTTATTTTLREALVHVVEQGRGGEERRASKPMPSPPDHHGMAGLGWASHDGFALAMLCDLGRTRRRVGRSGFHVSLPCRPPPSELFPSRRARWHKSATRAARNRMIGGHGESSPRRGPRTVWVGASAISDPAGCCFPRLGDSPVPCVGALSVSRNGLLRIQGGLERGNEG